ncbi:MAG: Holliday junction branch migration protein RuvA [Anaerolineae bacterium]|jgi:Holliday junction DNA helicase RuvA
MIWKISGGVWDTGDGYVVIRAGGVGYRVDVPSDVLEQISGIDQPVELFTHFYVRENKLALYGFLTKEKRALFELLLEISGVGPSVALSVLSTLSPDALRQAVLQDEPGLLTRVPGIGSKTAKKIIFHLRDKVIPATGDVTPLLTDADTEVIAALTALGFSLVEAQSALQRLPRDEDLSVEERVRLALSSLA